MQSRISYWVGRQSSIKLACVIAFSLFALSACSAAGPRNYFVDVGGPGGSIQVVASGVGVDRSSLEKGWLRACELTGIRDVTLEGTIHLRPSHRLGQINGLYHEDRFVIDDVQYTELYAHEFVHYLLEKRDGNPDATHSLPVWQNLR